MGASGKLSDYAMQEAEAEKYLPILEGALKTETNPERKKELQDQIDNYNNTLSTSDLTKLGTAALYAGSEIIFERFGSVALRDDLIKVLKASGNNKSSYAKALLKIPQAQVREGGTEGLTQLTQNISDIYIDGQEKNILEGVPDATVQGALIGTGFGTATGFAMARGHMLDVIVSKEEKEQIKNGLDKINILNEDLQKEGVTKKDKKTIQEQIKKIAEDINFVEKGAIENFLSLSRKEQDEIFELDKKSREVNSEWVGIAADQNVSESSKDILKEQLKEKFDKLQNEKRNILKTKQNEKELQFAVEGDFIRNQLITKGNLRDVKEHNKGTNWANKITGVSQNDLKSIQEFIEGKKKTSKNKTITLEDGSVINESEGKMIIVESLKPKDGFFERGSKHVVVFTDRATDFNKSAAVHEYLHAAFASLGFTEKQFNAIRDDLVTLVNDKTDKGELTTEQKELITAKLKAYTAQDKKQGTKNSSEELLAIISDAVNENVIKETDKSFLGNLRNTFKNVISTVTGRNIANEFKLNTAEEAYDFIKTFNKKIVRGESISAAAVGPSDNIKTEEGKADSLIVDLYNKYNSNKTTMISESMLKTPQGQETFDFTKSEFGQAVGGLVETITKRLYDPVLDDLKRATTRDEFKNRLISELGTIINNEYDPAKQDIGKFSVNRLNLRANRIATETFGQQVLDDVTEARTVAAEPEASVVTIDSAKPIEDVLKNKTILDNVDKATELASIKAENELKAYEEKQGKKATNTKKVAILDKALFESYRRELFDILKEEFGKNTAKSEDFSNFLNTNYESLLNTALTYINYEKANAGIASEWNIDNPPSKEEFVDYYEGKDITPNQPASTKSDRKKKLIEAVIKDLANKGKIQKAKNDPRFKELLKNKFNVVSSIILPPKNGPQNLKYKNLKQLLENNGIKYDFLLNTVENVDEFFTAIQPILNELPVEMLSDTLLRPTGRIFKKGLYGNRNKSKKQKEEYNKVNKYFDIKRKQAIKEAKSKTKNKFTGKAEGIVFKPFDLMGKTEKQVQQKFDDGYIPKQNEQNMAAHEQIWNVLYKYIQNNPKNKSGIRAIGWLLSRTSDGGASHWHRIGAEVIGYSLNPKGNGKKLYEWEHAVPAKDAYLFLLDSALNGVDFAKSYSALKRNYKVIALDAAMNTKITKAGFGDSMPENFNVYTGSWVERYFNPFVFIQNGGILPTSIVNFANETFADIYNVTAAGQSNITDSVILNEQFNKMLEVNKGVDADAVYSEARAKKLGATRNPYKFFVPYSGEDFVGLIYPTLGKGKIGDENLQWYKENLIDPYAKGIRDFETTKQQSLRTWAELKKKIKNAPETLNKKAVRDFSNEDAIRLYLWDKQGILPEGVAKKDIDAITKYIKSKPELQKFADEIQLITEGTYPEPGSDWLGGSITTDLIEHIDTVKRSEFLKPWKDNVDVIYSKDNLNKLRATFGDNYVEALKDILYRMSTGSNRPTGQNRLANEWLNWLNNSVGGIMFFNSRSALLQTISAVNYINFSDNNPLRIAEAFGNQPQFWKDFSFLFNSDFLKQRRGGLQTDVNADEIAQAADKSKNKMRAGIAYLLKKGFIPTQYADSFAISFGGATFYRNRIKSLMKDGMEQKQAEEQAYLDWKEISEEAQQSSRPDRVSMQQASPLGRIILAFGNTPIQYARIMKKAALDLANGRGDWKTNLSKLIWYGAVQNVIFTALQNALFAIAFSDEDDDSKRAQSERAKYVRSANSIVDTLLRGAGLQGAIVAAGKNIILNAIEQTYGKELGLKKANRKDYEKSFAEITTLSPPLDSKLSKFLSVGRTFKYKQEREKMRELGFSIENPAFMAGGRALSVAFNIPADRVLQKMLNIKYSLNKENELWQSIGLAMGYPTWDLMMEDPVKKRMKQIKIDRELGGTGKPIITNDVTPKLRTKEDLYNLVNSPAKKLENLPDGVLGKAHKDGTIQIREGLSKEKRKEVIAHEKQHVKDMKSGRLNYDSSYVYWEGKKYPRTSNKKIIFNGKALPEGHRTFPWEKSANKVI